MLENLVVSNYPAALPIDACGPHFVLRTCQRTLVVMNTEALPPTIPHSFGSKEFDIELKHGKEAYHFLLRIISGMESRMMAEYEIVGQFKAELRVYLQATRKDPFIIRVIEKLLKDSKDLRTRYLNEIGQKTYAALVRKKLLAGGDQAHVLIMGTGSMAIDLINQMKKKTRVFLTGRNSEKVFKLCQEHELTPVKWLEYQHYLQFPRMANTIGAHERLIPCDFFQSWAQQHQKSGVVVDLGTPSPLDIPEVTHEARFFDLKDIFAMGAIKEKEKFQKIKNAENFIGELVERRYQSFQKLLQNSIVFNKNSYQ